MKIHLNHAPSPQIDNTWFPKRQQMNKYKTKEGQQRAQCGIRKLGEKCERDATWSNVTILTLKTMVGRFKGRRKKKTKEEPCVCVQTLHTGQPKTPNYVRFCYIDYYSKARMIFVMFRGTRQ
jgi:hypothetical protein